MPTKLAFPRRHRPFDGLVTFLRQVFRDYHHTGAVMPSSPALARAMTRSIHQASGPKRVLEVGPGTGVFTRSILEAMRAGDELHIVEINQSFADRLERKILAQFRMLNPESTVSLHCQPIESAEIVGRFDFIVCGLPFNNFPPAVVRRIFRRLMALLEEGGELVYFEYAGVRVMKGSISSTKGRQKLKQIQATGHVLRRRHNGTRELVIGNVPPAVAVRLSRETSG